MIKTRIKKVWWVCPPILLSIHYQFNLVHNRVSKNINYSMEDLEISFTNKTLFDWLCRDKIPKVNNGPGAPHEAQPWPKGKRGTKRLLVQSCWAQFIWKDVRGGVSPRTHKYGPNVRPLHSEEPSQTNVGSRMSLTQQERGKCKTSREKPQLPH